jgi:GNAT superfamily N-acetyltransferase
MFNYFFLPSNILSLHCQLSLSVCLSNSHIYIYYTAVDATIREIYQINPPPLSATIAAIIYMFVEPNYRHRNVGSLALSVISAIQSVQAVDFTVLVATAAAGGGDDDTLVQWYERNGYTKAPLLQDVMGSPNGKFGVTMIAPVGVKEGFFDECNLKWW